MTTATTTTITIAGSDGRPAEQRTYNSNGTIASPTATESRRWLIGLDLARSVDFTAAIVLERVQPASAEAIYHVRQILRVRNRPYPDIVAAVRELLANPDLRGAALVVDETGVGMAVVDMLKVAGMAPIAITITAGLTAERAMGGWHVPKRELVSLVEVLLQQGRLRIAAELPHARTLTEELAAFEVHISAAGRDTYGARLGEHDDLVLACALGCWFGERPTVRFF